MNAMVADNKFEKTLNKEQLAAIEYGDGPLLIIAGAGTGKTTVITERIKWLIASGKAKSSEVLALTFTDKAAREMEERIDIALPYGYTDLWVSTFHSFCDRILRDEILNIGLDPGYRLMSEIEATQFLIKNIFKLNLHYFRPLGNPTKFVSGLMQHFSRLKDEDVLPDHYLAYAERLSQKNKKKSEEEQEEAEKIKELSKAYLAYEEMKTKEGLMDFGDLIIKCLNLFRTRKAILKKYQDLFKYILIDEFQDTNYSQNQLAMLLAGEKENLTVCADDDQAVYRFRGAAVSNVIQFREHYKKAQIVVLSQNYRSVQSVLDYAYTLIQNNNPDRLEVKEKINKRLTSVRGIKGEKIEFLHANKAEDEAEMVGKTIRRLVNETNQYEYKDVAILVRANNQAEIFAQALGRLGIPYQFLGPGQLFRQAEVKDLIAYLKFLYNIYDNVAIYRVLSMPILEILPRDLAAVSGFAKMRNLALMEACEEVDNIFVSPSSKEKIKSFVSMAHRHLALVPCESAGKILYYFLEDTGFLKKLADNTHNLEEKQVQNIAKFFERIKNFETNNENASVESVVDWINLSMNLGDSPLVSNMDLFDEDRVNILTVHSSKGLEFPVVFLVNLVCERFPSRERREQIPLPGGIIKEILPQGDYHTQEERRLFYVGMTRARDRLYLTAADYYGEAKRKKKISPFVIETLGKGVVNEYPTQENQLSIFDFQPVAQTVIKEAKTPLNINSLSYSQIDTFQTCPRLYRFRYLQRIPVALSAPLTFGDTIHRVLRDFYFQIKNGTKPTFDQLEQMLESKWSPFGFTGREHEERMKIEGRKMLKKFYDTVDFNRVPLALEQSFAIKISPNLTVRGKIDRIDKVGEKFEIIDYKTGKLMEQNVVKKSLQMTVYALAVTDPGIYNKKPEDLVLTFYFLEKNKKRSTTRTTGDLQKAKEEIIKIAQSMSKSDFQPNPGFQCDFCEFKLLCEAWS